MKADKNKHKGKNSSLLEFQAVMLVDPDVLKHCTAFIFKSQTVQEEIPLE
jgi:hypothetical protein